MSTISKSDKESLNKICIPLTAREKSGIDRCLEPIQIGIPFPKGEIYDASGLIVRCETGETIPFDISVSDTWSDKSIRWVLCDIQVNVPAHGERVFNLEEAHSVPKIAEGPLLRVEESPERFLVKTSAADFCVDRRVFLPFQEISLNGIEFNSGKKSGMFLIDDKDNTWHGQIESSCMEQLNHIRATFYLEGGFVNGGRKHTLRFIARCFFYAGKRFARLDFTLWNPQAADHPGGLWDLGDRGSVLFCDLTLTVSAGFSTPVRTLYKTEVKGELRETGEVLIYQDSSGGENWRSRNHVNHRGEIPVSFRGYRVSESGGVMSEGLRASPIFALVDGKRSIHAALRHFWQNFPSAIETKGEVLRISLFPSHFKDIFEMQGGERKTHSMYLEFKDEITSSPDLEWIHDPLIMCAPPAWYATSGALPYLVSEAEIPSEWPWPEIRKLKDTIVQKGPSFKGRREIIDEYGWRNFGDIFADHETLLYEGEKPIISHYNNQYDLINSFIMNYIRSGDKRWFCLSEHLALHVMDIDIYHTDKDRYEYNHGLFWHTDHYTSAATATHRSYSKQTIYEKNLKKYGGGPSYEHLYLQGLLNYYYLAGDLQAKDAVCELAKFASNGIEGPQIFFENIKYIINKVFKFLKKGIRNNSIRPYGLFDGPGRASGNVLSALIDAFQLTSDKYYLNRAEYLIKRCASPNDDLSRRNLQDVNMRWSYTIFLQSLCKYLDIKSELKNVDDSYDYAKSILLHFSKWMIDNEFSFLEKPDLIDFPNFATRAATDIRKVNVLLLATKYANDNLKKRLFDKAMIIWSKSMRDLLSFEEKTTTRPLAILMQNMNIPLFYATNATWNKKIAEEGSHL